MSVVVFFCVMPGCHVVCKRYLFASKACIIPSNFVKAPTIDGIPTGFLMLLLWNDWNFVVEDSHSWPLLRISHKIIDYLFLTIDRISWKYFFLRNFPVYMSDNKRESCVVVTGAASGIGKSICLELDKKGLRIALWDINQVIKILSRKSNEPNSTT